MSPTNPSAGPELVELLHRFFHYLDTSRYAELVAMFDEQGVWLRQGEKLRGHAAILEAMNARPTTQRIRHIITNAFVAKGENGEATLQSYMTAYRYDDGTVREGVVKIPGPFRVSVVSTTFRRGGADWRIVEQDIVPEFEFDTR